MIKSSRAGGVGSGEIASLQAQVEVSQKARVEQKAAKSHRAFESEVDHKKVDAKKSLVGDEVVPTDFTLVEEGMARQAADIEQLTELAQYSAGGSVTDSISPYPDADTGFGEERVQALFGPGALGVNPVFAAVGIAAVSVTDNSDTATVGTTPPMIQPGSSYISGVVIDGYIRGAKVFFDTDGDGQHDEGEAFTLTDAEGKYVLTVSQGVEGVVRAVGGTNINPDGTDGAPNTATLSAPLVRADDNQISLNITPITTLIEAFAQSGDGLAASEASSRLADALGLEGVDLLTFDSILAEAQSEDPTQKSQALALNKIAAQVVSLINSVSTALQPDSSDRAAVDSVVAQSVAQQVVAKIIDSETGGLTSLSSILDSDTLGVVVQTAVSAVMASGALSGGSVVRDTAGVLAAAKGSASAQISAIDKATSAGAIAAEQVAIFNNKAPTAGVSQVVSVAENSKDVGIFEASDPDEGDAITYSLAGNDAVFFDIDLNTGNVKFKVGPDFEQIEGRPYQFTVLATDNAGASSTQQVTVNVTDVDEVAATEALMAEIIGLKSDIASAKAELDKARLDADARQKALNDQIAALEASGEAKDADLVQLKADLKKTIEEAAAKQKALETDIAKAKAQIDALTKDSELKDADIVKLKTDISTAEAALKKAVEEATAKQKALEADIVTAKAQVEALTLSGEAKDTDIAKLKTDISTAEAALKKAVEEATAKQKTLEAEIAKANEQIAALIKSGETKDADILQLKADVTKAETALKAVEADAALKQKALEEKVAALEASNAAKDADIAQLKGDLMKAVEEAAATQKGLEQDISALKSKVDALTQSGNAKDADIAALKKSVEELTGKLDAVEKDAALQQKALEDKVALLEASGKAKDADIAQLKSDLTKVTEEAAAKQKLLEQDIGEFKVEVEALTQSGKAKDADILKLKSDVSEAKAALEQAKLDAAAQQKQLENTVKVLTDDVAQLKADLEAREADVAVLKNIIEELGPHIDKVILGTTGNDTITNKTGENFIYGLSGNDTIVFNDVNELFGEGMVDSINGGAGLDTLRLIDANDRIEFSDSWAKASGVEVLQVAGTQTTPNGFQAYLDSSAFTAGIRTIDLREIVAMPSESLTSVVDGSNAASTQGLTILGTGGNDLFTGGAGQDTLTGNGGADTYHGGAGNDLVDLGESDGFHDRVVFETTGEGNGADLIKAFQAGLASGSADVLDLSAFTGNSGNASTPMLKMEVASLTASSADFLDVVVTENPVVALGLGSGVNGDVIRLLDLEGGQDITTAEGLQAALRSDGEYSNIDIAASTKSIVVTSGSLNSGDSFVFMLTGDESGVEFAQLVAVVENVALNTFTADNFVV